MPRIVSTFAGGGLKDKGFEEAGCEVVAAVELDRYACATWRHNRPGQEDRMHQTDVTLVTAETLGIQPRTIDGMIGGPPCPGFSPANNKRPQAGGNVHRWKDDPRNLLYQQYARLLKELQPGWFVMENVKTMYTTGADATGQPGPIMLEVLTDLSAAGYRVAARVLDAADYGAPQHRERTIVIGIRQDLPGAIRFPIQTHGEHGSGYLLYKTVRDAIADLPPPTETVANHTGAMVIRDGGYTYQQKNYVADWDEPSPTLNCNRLDHPPIHPAEARRLTPRECARLQTVPDDYVFCGPKTAAYRQIGNGVPVELARRIAATILGREPGVEVAPYQPQLTLFDQLPA